MTTKRLMWVDVCRGLAILAIFIGHVGAYDQVANFVFRYHVHLFFFLSGFFFSRRQHLPFKEYLSKSVWGVLVPYFFFCLINIAFYMIITRAPLGILRSYIPQALFGIRNHIEFAGQLWFFPCLFVIQMLYFGLARLLPGKPLRLLVTFFALLASAVFLTLPGKTSWFFNIDSALFFIFFYALGDVVYPMLDRLHASEANTLHRTALVLLGIALIGAAFVIYVKDSAIDARIVAASNYVNHPLVSNLIRTVITFFLALFLIAANVALAIALSGVDYLAYVGRNTLLLCGFENIAAILIGEAFFFFDLALKTEGVINQVFITILKVLLIQVVFFPIFQNNLGWAVGRARKPREIQEAPAQAQSL